MPLPLIARIVSESEKPAASIIDFFKSEIELLCLRGTVPKIAGFILSEQIAQALGWAEVKKLGVQTGVGLNDLLEQEQEFNEWLTEARKLISIGTAASS